jgi:hypothetical protein
MDGHFRSFSQISTAPTPTVLCIDMPTQVKPSFISEECRFRVMNTFMYCEGKKVTKLCSSLIFTFQLLEPVLINMALVSTAFFLVYFLSKKDPVECTFLTNLKIIYEAGTWTPEYLQQNFVTRFIRSIFHVTCHIQKSIVEVYISPSLLL